ncbi:MAG: DegV family protein [Agathobacter sp.]|nr:DegV family protein [Agathobacter sp.]MBQ6812362.1 DegV family protein [Agathobacter sp.]
MKMRLVADSSANLSTTPDNSIVSVPLTLRTDEREFVDNDSLDIKEMTDYLASYKGKSGSACPSSQDWVDAFGDAEEVFAIAITSNLSGSFNSLRIAKEEYEEEHPDRKVCIIDSLSAGPELKLVVEKIQELHAEGKTFEEISAAVEEYQKQTHLIFCLKSLTNLANNGRVNPAVAKIAGVLNIHVVGIASSVGTLEQREKARGPKKALAAIDMIMKEFNYNGGKVIIDHCFNEADAIAVKDYILTTYPNADVRISETKGLCSFYAEVGGLMIGYEG